MLAQLLNRQQKSFLDSLPFGDCLEAPGPMNLVPLPSSYFIPLPNTTAVGNLYILLMGKQSLVGKWPKTRRLSDASRLAVWLPGLPLCGGGKPAAPRK